MAAIEEAVPADVLSAALYVRFRSRQEHTFAEKLLSAMRKGFGGHVEPGAPGDVWTRSGKRRCLVRGAAEHRLAGEHGTSVIISVAIRQQAKPRRCSDLDQCQRLRQLRKQ